MRRPRAARPMLTRTDGPGETASAGITVNAIVPGMILTPMNKRAIEDIEASPIAGGQHSGKARGNGRRGRPSGVGPRFARCLIHNRHDDHDRRRPLASDGASAHERVGHACRGTGGANHDGWDGPTPDPGPRPPLAPFQGRRLTHLSMRQRLIPKSRECGKRKFHHKK